MVDRVFYFEKHFFFFLGFFKVHWQPERNLLAAANYYLTASSVFSVLTLLASAPANSEVKVNNSR